MGSSKKIFSGVVWSIIMNVVNAVYGFIMIPILISYFGKAEYGLIGLAQSVNAYMRLMDMGLTSTNVRFFSNWITKGENEKVKKLLSTCSSFYGFVGLLNAAVLLLVCLFSESIFNVTPEQNAILQQLLIILAVSAIVNWFTSCYNQIIQATENVAWTQRMLLLTKLLMVATIFATVYFKFSIILYVALTVICSWLTLPWIICKIKQLLPFISFLPKFDKATFKEILPYTLNIFSFTIFSFSYNNLKPVFLGMQSTPESVTDFKVIMGIVGIVSSVTGVFMTTLLPAASKVIANNDKQMYYRIAYQGTKYLTVFMGFCVFGMMTVAGDLLTLYVGESYNYLLPWLLIMVFLQLANHNNSLSSLVLAGTNIKPLSQMTAISSIAALIVAWFLIPSFGVGGVVLSTAFYSVAQIAFYYIYYCPKVLKVDSWQIIRTILIPVMVIGLGLWFGLGRIPHFENHLVNVFTFGAVFTVLYCVFVLLYLTKDDKEFLRNIFRKSNK